MKVVAYYSFKGGVGRTMSLLSTAYTLARRGRKVVLADWDLQAPGLSLMQCLRPQDAGLPRLGILEYLAGLHPDRWSESQPIIEQMLLPARLIDDARQRQADSDTAAMRGDLFFIPAGDLAEGVETFIANVKRAELHNLKQFLVSIDRDPRMVFKVFRQQVETAAIPWRGEGLSGPPDYLLIDSRTGITEIGDLLLGDATDFTAIVYGQDEQNLEGLRIVLNASPREPGDLAAHTMLIWSGAVAGQEEEKVRQQRHKKRLVDDVCRPDSLGLPEPFPQEFVVPFNPDLVFSDLPLVHRVPDGEFAALFERITDYLEERCLWRDKIIEGIIAPINPQEPMSEEQRRLKIASTPESQQAAHLCQAHLELDLSRGLTPLLFNPPPWNLAGIPTPELVETWPDDFSSKVDQDLYLQLLAYSLSIPAVDKLRLLRTLATIPADRAREALRILTVERHQWLRMSQVAYWSLLKILCTRGAEWMAMLIQLPHWPEEGRSKEEGKLKLAPPVMQQLDGGLRKLVTGEPLPGFAESAHPLFPVLMSEAIRATAESRERFLSQWLASRQLNANELHVSLTEKACSAADNQGLSTSVRAFCWERYADALDDLGRTTEEAEKAQSFDRAIAAYQRSLELRPDDATTLNNLGNSLDNRGRAAEKAEKAQWFDRAIAAHQRSLELRPDDAATLNNLGNSLDNLGISLGDRGQVADQAEKAQWFDRAIAAYQRSLELRPDDAATLLNLGISLDNRAQAAQETEKAHWFDRAIAAYQRSLELRPDDAATLNNLGSSLDNRGRAAEIAEKAQWFDRAIAAYQRSLELRPDDAATLNNLGNSLDNRGRAAEEAEKAQWYDRAIGAFQRALELTANDVATLNNLTNALLLKQRVAEPNEKAILLANAAEVIEKASAIDARTARYNRACVLALQGNSEEALQEIRQLLAEDPGMRRQVAEDDDFELLAQHPEFQKLVQMP